MNTFVTLLREVRFKRKPDGEPVWLLPSIYEAEYLHELLGSALYDEGVRLEFISNAVKRA